MAVLGCFWRKKANSPIGVKYLNFDTFALGINFLLHSILETIVNPFLHKRFFWCFPIVEY
jgi:hypothetical protein